MSLLKSIFFTAYGFLAVKDKVHDYLNLRRPVGFLPSELGHERKKQHVFTNRLIAVGHPFSFGGWQENYDSGCSAVIFGSIIDPVIKAGIRGAVSCSSVELLGGEGWLWIKSPDPSKDGFWEILTVSGPFLASLVLLYADKDVPEGTIRRCCSF